MLVIKGPDVELPGGTLLQMLDRAVAGHRDQRALIFAGQETTFGELQSQVRTLMGALRQAGVGQGDRVGIMLPNCQPYAPVYYAVVGIGAIVVQISPISAAPELAHYLRDSGCKLLVVYAPLLPLVRAVRTPELEQVAVVRLGPADISLAPGEEWFDQFITTGVAGDQTAAPIDPQTTVAVLQYTGGTTGRSKGAMLTHRNLVANVYQAAYFIPGGLQADDLCVCVLPLFHVYAMTICMNMPLALGVPILLVPRFDVQELLQIMETYRPTLFAGVPTMYVALAQAAASDPSRLQSLRLCNSGGASLPGEVLRRFEHATGAQIAEGYGLSETSPVTHSSVGIATRRVGSIGQPAPNTEVKVVDLEDPSKDLPLGEAGELAIRGPQVMLGYWQQPQETAQVLRDGWLLTGDIARMDAEGYAYIVDRKKDLIIAGGFNIYPRDVEEVLYAHPAVLEAAAVGVPDEYRGETVKAFVVLKAGETATADALGAWCRERLAAYKVPHLFEFRSALPKTGVGKILRRELRTESIRE